MHKMLHKATALFLSLATAITATQFASVYSLASSNDFTVVNGVLTKYSGDISDVRIPSNVNTIGDYAFQECSEIEKVTIPTSVTSIGRYAFTKCENLKKITIPDSVTAIGNFAFLECDGLKSVTLSNKLKTIGISSFSGCSDLSELEIPNSVISIGKNAFEDCSDLETVTISSNLKVIGTDAFSGCGKVTIRGYRDTPVQKYADNNGITFRDLGQGTLTLDSKNVVVAPKDSYTIGYKMVGNGLSLKVYSSKAKMIKLKNLGGGEYEITGIKTGTTYLMFDVYKDKKRLAHASVKVYVKSGVAPRGDKSKQTAKF